MPEHKLPEDDGQYCNKVITLRDNLGSKEEQILIHELIHYALDRSGLNYTLYELSNKTDALEEGIVRAIEKQLAETGVLVVNPKLKR